jgi:hypothetical protein
MEDVKSMKSVVFHLHYILPFATRSFSTPHTNQKGRRRARMGRCVFNRDRKSRTSRHHGREFPTAARTKLYEQQNNQPSKAKSASTEVGAHKLYDHTKHTTKSKGRSH